MYQKSVIFNLIILMKNRTSTIQAGNFRKILTKISILWEELLQCHEVGEWVIKYSGKFFRETFALWFRCKNISDFFRKIYAD